MKDMLINELEPEPRTEPRATETAARDPVGAGDDGLAAAVGQGQLSPPPLPDTSAAQLVRAAFVAIAFAGVSLLARAAVRVYFGRLSVEHRERFPARGPVLLVANHPAMWTDVLVLDVALGRKLHFLAQAALFRPLARAVLLRLHGALPVVAAPHGEDDRAHNAATFQRCRELFARAEVVALFPEGVSLSNRGVLRLKSGAARIALDRGEDPLAGASPTVLPAGIHYSNRTSFGSRVTVSLGEPIALAPYRALVRIDPESAVRALTEHMHRALRALILDLPEPTLAAAVAELEPLAELAHPSASGELESARRIATRLQQIRVAEPRRFAAIQRHSRAYRKSRRALAVSDRALLWDRHTTPWRQRTTLLVVLCALGAAPAAAGALLHAAPWAAGELISHRVGVDPVRFSFARIASGIVLFPVTYLLLSLVALRAGLLAPEQLLPALAITVALGLWTLGYSGWARGLLERARMVALERRVPRLVKRARAEQRALLRLLAETAAPTAPRAGGVT